MLTHVERHWAVTRRQSLVPFVEHGSTWLSKARLNMLETHLKAIESANVPGAIVECGVAKGGSAALLGSWITNYAPHRKLVLFDTFDGLPPPTADDPDYETAIEWTGKCLGTLDDVLALFRRHGIPHRQITFVKGMFQDTIPDSAPEAIAFAHLDGDWYASTKHCLDHMWPRLSVWGRVQLDDYGTWQGCRKATDEFLASTPSVAVHPIDPQGIWLEKTGSGGR